MDSRWTLIACVMSLGLAGCETTGATIGVTDLSAPVTAQPAGAAQLSPDIRKILAAGGLEGDVGAGAHGAVPGRMTLPTSAPPSQAVLAAAANPASPAAVAPSSAVALAAPVDVPARGGRGRRKGKADPAAMIAAAPTPAAPPAPQTAEYVAAAPGASRELPAGPLPAVSPLSPPPTTVRLASAAGDGLSLPPGAPTETTVTVAQPRSYNMNFTQGMPLSSPQPPMQRQAALQPGVYGGIVSGPSAQQVLQPMLDPNSLVSAPRFTSRSHVQLTAHAPKLRVAPEARMEAYAPQASIAAAMPAPLRTPAPAPPPPRDDTPVVRRF